MDECPCDFCEWSRQAVVRERAERLQAFEEWFYAQGIVCGLFLVGLLLYILFV